VPVLTDPQRIEVRQEVARQISEERLTVAGVTKNDLGAAVAALDVFFDGNLAPINNAIPEPCRSALTPRQKALTIVGVLRKRYGIS
jgi:hypothetical protein